MPQTTGTTRKEVTQVFNATARRMSTGKLTAQDTRAIRRALQGGPMAGVSYQPKVAANKVQKARKIYKRKTS